MFSDNRAMTSLNISDNNIGQCVQDPELMKLHGVTYEESKSGKMLYWSKDNKNLGEECPTHCCSPMGVAALADAIKDMGALTSLDISSNRLVGEKGTGRYKTVAASDSAEYESDEEEEIMDPEYSGIIALADVIPDMGAMMSLNLADNNIGGYYTDKGYSYEKFHPTPEGVCTQLPLLVPFSSLFPLFVGPAAIADAIKDMGALVRRCQNGKRYKSNKDDQGKKVKVCKHCGKKKSEHPKKAVSDHPTKHSQHKLMLVVPTRGPYHR
jgi:hypothetical protein